MDFIFQSSLYSLLGLTLGFFTHLFFGIVKSSITFDKKYVMHLVKSLLMLIFVFGCANIVMVPFIEILSRSQFTKDLVYYLMAFAAFDFTEKVIKYDGDFAKK